MDYQERIDKGVHKGRFLFLLPAGGGLHVKARLGDHWIRRWHLALSILLQSASRAIRSGLTELPTFNMDRESSIWSTASLARCSPRFCLLFLVISKCTILSMVLHCYSGIANRRQSSVKERSELFLLMEVANDTADLL